MPIKFCDFYRVILKLELGFKLSISSFKDKLDVQSIMLKSEQLSLLKFVVLMNKISIVNREMTSKEFARMNAGFDELSIEEGVELESSHRYSFVALKGNTFIGCSSGLAYRNGENYSGWFFLTDLFVEKEFRSAGLGAKLLNSMEEEVASIGVKQVWLWTSGEKSLRFYRRHNYSQFTEMENWYSDGSSRVGLRKRL